MNVFLKIYKSSPYFLSVRPLPECTLEGISQEIHRKGDAVRPMRWTGALCRVELPRKVSEASVSLHEIRSHNKVEQTRDSYINPLLLCLNRSI